MRKKKHVPGLGIETKIFQMLGCALTAPVKNVQELVLEVQMAGSRTSVLEEAQMAGSRTSVLELVLEPIKELTF